ncbi:MAG: hypothetical protein B7Z37_13755 [Verrucomicrobia bacterium 12-59-8]|nr:MAG: hypothetical protein B7Z37_13755 [Verrucomicrobia bacterium 12-59-8]
MRDRDKNATTCIKLRSKHLFSSFYRLFFIIHGHSNTMRITVEIEDDIISDAMELTGEKNKSPAIAKAVEQYVKRMRAKEFGKRLREGFYDYPSTNAEIEALEII